MAAQRYATEDKTQWCSNFTPTRQCYKSNVVQKQCSVINCIGQEGMGSVYADGMHDQKMSVCRNVAETNSHRVTVDSEDSLDTSICIL